MKRILMILLAFGLLGCDTEARKAAKEARAEASKAIEMLKTTRAEADLKESQLKAELAKVSGIAIHGHLLGSDAEKNTNILFKKVGVVDKKADTAVEIATETSKKEGPQGKQGLPGLNGLDGANGKDGRDGVNGLPGTPGRNGIDGLHGLDGKDGAPGPKGDKGDKGDRGDKGEKGDPGLPGERGERGEQGEQGEQGLQGLPGIDGRDGRDGAQGIPGPRGLDGQRGERGTQGNTGETRFITDAVIFEELKESVNALKYREDIRNKVNAKSLRDGYEFPMGTFNRRDFKAAFESAIKERSDHHITIDSFHYEVMGGREYSDADLNAYANRGEVTLNVRYTYYLDATNTNPIQLEKRVRFIAK